jgi:hypothetical protein
MSVLLLFFSSFDTIHTTESYIKAQEPNNFLNVIEAAKKHNLYEDLVRYLQMAR